MVRGILHLHLRLVTHTPRYPAPLTFLPFCTVAGVLPQRDWGGDDFEWSKEMGGLLRGTFGLSSWRTNQKVHGGYTL